MHRILISGGNGRIKHVAAQLDMGYDNFYARLCGRVAFNADDIRCLFAVTLRAIAHGLSDGKFDHRDRALARQKVNDSERALATLRTLLVDDAL